MQHFYPKRKYKEKNDRTLTITFGSFFCLQSFRLGEKYRKEKFCINNIGICLTSQIYLEPFKNQTNYCLITINLYSKTQKLWNKKTT